jgi:AcrR family transcriptional regulator
MTKSRSVKRGPRSDAMLNREKLLDAATIAVRRHGEKVPMSIVADLAGVGVGTLYRHFGSREEMLGVLTERSFEMVLGRVRRAASNTRPAIESLGRFFEDTIEHGEQLVLPLHGGPSELDARSRALDVEIRRGLEDVLARGRADGSIRSDATATDVIIAGAQLAQPLPHVTPWGKLARRQAHLMLAGLAATGDTALPYARVAGAAKVRRPRADAAGRRPPD